MDNKNIGCSVESCKFHSSCQNCCTLSAINVGKDGAETKDQHCTCCNSFTPKEKA